MSKNKIISNIFSNWTSLVLSIGVAFFVSPIIVHNLGNEIYGVWLLIVSITEYFTILDFGVSTAIVRFISKYHAQNDRQMTRQVYSNSYAFFFFISLSSIILFFIAGFFFDDMFKITSLSKDYTYAVFMISGIATSLSILALTYSGTCMALQEFKWMNIISVTTMILKNIALVIMLLNGYKLMSMAILQLIASVLTVVMYIYGIYKKHPYLKFNKSDLNSDVFKMIFSYSVYSFVITVALRILFYTDSIVIGSMLSVSLVAFYTIPMTLMTYLERLVYSAMSVLIPVISSNDAQGNLDKNKELYMLGSKYSLMISLPILFILYTNGDSFISMWMGPEFGRNGSLVLKILVLGYLFSLSQVIANGILKGMSRHKIFSYILIGEALCNLLMSVVLAPIYGIEGVAIGTTIPLIITNLIVVPIYTCKILDLSYSRYLYQSFYAPLVIFFLGLIMFHVMPIKVNNYYQLTLFSVIVVLVFFGVSIKFILYREHRYWLISEIKGRVGLSI